MAEKSIFDLLLILIKNIVMRFTELTKPSVNKMIDILLANGGPITGNAPL